MEGNEGKGGGLGDTEGNGNEGGRGEAGLFWKYSHGLKRLIFLTLLMGKEN